MNNEIDIYGTLNAATVEGIIAKAEQIGFNLPGGTRVNLSDYVRQNAQFRSGEYIKSYILSQNEYSAIFICVEDLEDFQKKHIYYYDGSTKTYEDITPEGGGGGSGGSMSGRPTLSIKTTLKSEYTTDENIEISYYWESLNTGYGRCYFILDGRSESKREIPCNVSGDSSRTWTIGKLARGTHHVEIYVVDSASISSNPRWSANIVVGGLEVESTFDEENYYTANRDLTVPYSVFNSSNLPHEVFYSWDDSDPFTSESSPITITSAMMTDGIHELKIWATTSEKESNVLTLSVISVVAGRVYVSPASNTAQTTQGSAYAALESGQQITFRTNIIELNGSTFRTTYRLYPADESYNKLSSTGTLLTTLNQSLGINSYTMTFNEGYYILEITAMSNMTTRTGKTEFYIHSLQSQLYTVDPITDGLTLWLDAKGKLNSAADKEVWTDKSNHNVNVELHNFNYATNGWVMNADGTSKNYLLINSRAYAVIDLEPFSQEISNGLTVDIEFSTRDVSNEKARVISCYSSPRGFFINTDTARLGSSASPTETSYVEKVEYDDSGDSYIVSTKTGPFELNFRQDVKTHLTFTIYRYNSQTRTYPISVMAMYLNGILAGVKEISENDSFITNRGQKIYLGCNPNSQGVLENFGECKIYNLRVYNRALNYEEIVTNMIYDIENPVEKDEKIRRNKIGPASTDSTLLVPEMTFTMFDNDFNNISKSDRKKAVISYRAPSGNITNLEDFGTVQWQGTSTLAYAVKNYKINIYSQTDYSKLNGISLGSLSEQEFLFSNLKDYGKKHKIDIGNGQTESKFTLKADYMDSSNSHNSGIAMFIPEMNTEETPIQKYIPSCRTSVYGFPMKLYLNRVPDNAVNNGIPDEAAGTTEVLGIYNFLLDKGCTDSLGLWNKNDLHDYLRDNAEVEEFEDWKAKYPYWDCLSFEISANSDSSAGSFNRNDYPSILQDFEYRFPDEDDLVETDCYGKYEIDGDTLSLEITNKYKLLADGSIDKKGDISSNFITNTYTKNANGDYVSSIYTLKKISNTLYRIEGVPSYSAGTVTSTSTIDITFIPDLTEDPSGNTGHVTFTESLGQIYMEPRVHLKKILEWIDESTDDEFYNEFEKHFNLSSVLDYYVLVLTLGMVDSLGKNLMFDTYGPGEVGRTYKNGRYAGQTITYTEEEKAQYDNYIWYTHFYDMDTCLGVDNSGNVRFDTDIEITQGVYNTSKSKLWTRFQSLFKREIYNRYTQLRENGTFTVDKFMEYFYDKQIAVLPEMSYNESFFSKYLATEERRTYLYMMHGSQYEYMYRWIDQRLYFLDTYFAYGQEYNAQCTVRVEYNDYATSPVTYKIQTYYPAYVYVIFKNSGDASTNHVTSDVSVRLKVGRGQTVDFSRYITTSTDQETIIFNAGNLKTFGDVSKYTPKAVLIDNAKKLTELIVGTEENPNPNLKTLSLGNNQYLTKIVAENCAAIDYSLDVSGCSNLESISLTGSSISSVRFPKGAPLKEVHLPASTSSLILDSLAILDTLTIEGKAKLNTITITNCPLLTGSKDEYGNITEGPFMGSFLTDYIPKDPLTRIKIDSLYGYVRNFDFLDAITSLALDYPENYDITGTVRYLGNTIPQLYSNYEDCFENLTVQYPNVNNVASMFESYKNITLIFTREETYPNQDGTQMITKTYYYWKDLRDGEFPTSAYVTYNGEKARSLAYYDKTDTDRLALEIKKLLSPFSKFTSTNSMFKDMDVLEYLDPETFDGIDMTNCSNSYMFDGCTKLKYFEVPNTMTKLGNYMFSNCYELTVFIPKTVTTIENTAFYSNNNSIGSHTVELFEAGSPFEALDSNPIYKYIRDARFNIEVDTTTGKALRTKDIILTNIEPASITMHEDYFKLKNSQYIYVNDIYNDTRSEVVIPEFNYNPVDPYENPMKIAEFLPGSLRYITGIQRFASPAYGIRDAFSSDAQKLNDLECSIGRMFDKGALSALKIENLPITDLYILSPDARHRKVNRYFAKGSMINRIFISKNITDIEEAAFQDSTASRISIENDVEVGNPCALTTIGDYAFENAQLTQIYIPNTVTSIGMGAFRYCQKFTDLHYSTAMNYIPESCFQGCLSDGSIPPVGSISGFSKAIKNIDARAFDGATGLMLFKKTENGATSFDCMFCCATENENIDYFETLENIGNYAFRNILNITRIDVPETLKTVGASAFIPPELEEDNETLLVWETDGDYSDLEIGASAFMGRQFAYMCDKSGFAGFTNPEDRIFRKVCYIPNVKSIDINAFTAESTSLPSTATLDFILTERDELNTESDSWSKLYAANHFRTIYNYRNALIHADSEGYSRILYFLTEKDGEKEALGARLVNTPNTVIIDESIDFEDADYPITELLDEIFVDKDENLYRLEFVQNSVVKRLGNRLFTTRDLSFIGVVDNTHNIINYTDSKGVSRPRYIPTSVCWDEEHSYSPIGSNNDFKSTQWFKYNTNLEDEFVYMNDYCLGYVPSNDGETNIINTTKTINNDISVIYEKAFNGNLFLSFTLPSSLRRIESAAFQNCTSLFTIDFTPCKDELIYIGDQAFQNSASLKEINYTHAIEYVGRNAFGNCQSVDTITFEEGTVMSNDSYPITPILNNDGINVTIKRVVIPESMGFFFSQDGPGYEHFTKLTQLSELVLGGIYGIAQLPEFDEDVDDPNDYISNGTYKLDFSTQMVSGTLLSMLYPHASYAGAPIKMRTNNSYFICPISTYNSSIDISYNKYSMEYVDILRLILGYKIAEGKTPAIDALRNVAAMSNAAVFTGSKEGRVVFNTVIRN